MVALGWVLLAASLFIQRLKASPALGMFWVLPLKYPPPVWPAWMLGTYRETSCCGQNHRIQVLHRRRMAEDILRRCSLRVTCSVWKVRSFSRKKRVPSFTIPIHNRQGITVDEVLLNNWHPRNVQLRANNQVGGNIAGKKADNSSVM